MVGLAGCQPSVLDGSCDPCLSHHTCSSLGEGRPAALIPASRVLQLREQAGVRVLTHPPLHGCPCMAQTPPSVPTLHAFSRHWLFEHRELRHSHTARPSELCFRWKLCFKTLNQVIPMVNVCKSPE